MAVQRKVYRLLGEQALESMEDCINEMDLALVTVRDVIQRNDGAPFEDSYIGVNLGLYVTHVDSIIMKCRELLDQVPSTKV